jgi:hypothetical protein
MMRARENLMDKTIIITIHKAAWGAVAPALDALDKAGADYNVTATDAAGPVPVPERHEPQAQEGLGGGGVSSPLNRSAFEAAIAEDVEWLKRQPDSLERRHILMILRDAPELYYGDASALYHEPPKKDPR